MILGGLGIGVRNRCQVPFLGLPPFLVVDCSLNFSTIFSAHVSAPNGLPFSTDVRISFSVSSLSI